MRKLFLIWIIIISMEINSQLWSGIKFKCFSSIFLFFSNEIMTLILFSRPGLVSPNNHSINLFQLEIAFFSFSKLWIDFKFDAEQNEEPNVTGQMINICFESRLKWLNKKYLNENVPLYPGYWKWYFSFGSSIGWWLFRKVKWILN